MMLATFSECISLEMHSMKMPILCFLQEAMQLTPFKLVTEVVTADWCRFHLLLNVSCPKP